MQNDKNKLFEQSDNQRSPGLARPEDFKINPPDTNEDYPFHGQLGDSRKECDALLEAGPKSRGEQNTAKGQTNSAVCIQREIARENAGTKQAGE